MDPEYGRHYRELYERHWWWRAREGAILRTVRESLDGRPRGHILDVGCGDGLFFGRLAEFGDVEGVEASADLITATGDIRRRIHIAPFDDRFQPGKRYSLVLMLDVLEHLEDPTSALRHAVRLLAPQGVFLATVPAFNAIWTGHDDLNHHVTRYTIASFREMTRGSGLRIDRARYFFHWLFAPKLASHYMEKLTGAKPSVPRIPPPWLNTLLTRLSDAEDRLLRRVKVPFGSSLMVVGGPEPNQPGHSS